MVSTVDLIHIHSMLSYVCLFCSVAFSALVFVLVRKSEKMDAFRHVLYSHCIADTVFAVAKSAAPMYWAHLPNTLLFFPTGQCAYWPVFAPFAFQLQALAYVFELCHVCFTFAHRHNIVSRLASTSHSTLRSLLIAGVIYFPVLQWSLTGTFLMKPNLQLRSQANLLLGSEYGIDFDRVYLVGVDLSDFFAVDPLLAISSATFLVEMGVLFSIIVCSGYEMHRFIKSSVVSDSSKKLQRRTLRMLICQVVHPIVLLLNPGLINFTQLIFNYRFSAELNFALATCFAIYPVTNPLLNLILSQELKAALCRLLHSFVSQRKTQVTVIFVSMNTFT